MRFDAIMRAVLALSIFYLSSAASADVWTASLPISKINYDGTTATGTAYFETPSGNWNISGCPNTQFVMVRDIPSTKTILALAMQAKASGGKAMFLGNCGSPGYFLATYIVIE